MKDTTNRHVPTKLPDWITAKKNTCRICARRTRRKMVRAISISMPGWNNAQNLLGRCLQQILCWRLLFLLLGTLALAHRSHGQWVPPAGLRNVPVLDNCKMTRHGVGASVQPTVFYPKGAIFLCPERAREIDDRHPGASRFFLVHEYGHLAMRTREEAVADEWAARQLASVPAERGTLKAVIWYF